MGKRAIELDSKVEVTVSPSEVSVKGPKGVLVLSLPSEIKVVVENGLMSVNSVSSSRGSSATHGLYRALISNMTVGVLTGFREKLEINGVGYRVQLVGSDLQFSLGYSHPVIIRAPEGVTFEVEDQTKFSVSGVDKQKVGQICAEIKRLRKKDPYKGKGIRFVGEKWLKKAGKSVK